MKYVNFTLQEMTPEQLKQNPITVHPNQNLDTDEGSVTIPKMKENLPHLKNCQKNILHLIYLLKKEESKPTETSQVLTIFNKTIHYEDDSSEDKSVTEIEPTIHITSKYNEDDSIEDQPITEFEQAKDNGEQNNGKENQLLTTNFEVEIEN